MSRLKTMSDTTCTSQPRRPALRWLEVFRTGQSSQPVFGSVLGRHGDLTAKNYVGVFYIGLGDQFDDDRRLARETPPPLSSAIYPA